MSEDENKVLRVAFLGPAASFSHEAAIKKFGDSGQEVAYQPVKTIAAVFQAVERDEADFGIVPVENSIEGAVTYTLDTFGRSDLKINGELEMPIREHLMVAPDGPKDLDAIKLVYSHPQPLAQCRNWLKDNLEWAETQEVSSTAAAAEIVLKNPEAAAIGGPMVAETYGLQILKTDLQDADFNYTRFLSISPEYAPRLPAEQRGQEKTALMLSIKDRVGALHAVTNVLLKYKLNMTRIESRPSKQKAWDYVFFIDILGHPQDPNVAQALNELADETIWVKVLGAWSR